MTALLRRLAVVTGGIAVSVAIWAAPAAAHVTVKSSEATKGGYAKLTLRVPNERDDASTTKLEVALPPLASVSVKPVAGWTTEVTRGPLPTPIKVHDTEVTEAVNRIVWTAQTPAAGIQPGQFAEFDISVGPLPESDTLVFKALQTYSNGTVVRWIDESTDAENPAPVLKLTAAAAAVPAAAVGVSADTDRAESGNGLAIGLATAGLLTGLIGLALGATAFVRTRRTT